MTSLAQVEGLVFIAGDEGISLDNLKALTEFQKPALIAMLDELARKYKTDDDCSFELLQNAEVYRLATKANLNPVIKQYFEEPLSTNLTQASLEVLAIIAYRQPVTRIEVDEIRGVQSSSIIQKLQLRNLIEDIGRKNKPGRPIIYGTSNYFLNYFGLKSLTELPQLTDQDNLIDNTEMTGDLFLAAFNKQNNTIQTDTKKE
ncbi:SMC-Scp complex subunit ScpB [Periweissella beninensis]|uniref:Segregation and condensation protein B n=1 Tax=Periweissella beninensis TaxID=504936 RepID=A0ABT0VG52_9LACO|nr:SMC-Scp complex subunit ScpB [Periweissella beninensis]MBM7543811.1 segregation and condensation protein B [Periweissella beninensis]MCM2436806.1 SMC-Scp complex subunit ScpB [Periweissella beninensis]MCT4395487.1 SMC-Scp complex subunit ScpB [Periweissella beninensis]